ncbi:hypothetical protein MAR_013005 [Mya arenaria]|uniref:Uncharacterized protein n=1 Tax=Mya arenaria TaxID=6604 RepID=A0ABY7G2L6_MYAAR|nr:hypothetical protein MAR_013005 [Mya arenaria]
MYFVSHGLGWKTYVGKPQNFNELSLPQQLVNSCALACKRPVPQPVPECSTLPNLQHQDGRYTTVKEVLGNVKYGRHYVLRYGCSCDIIAAQTHYHQVRPYRLKAFKGGQPLYNRATFGQSYLLRWPYESHLWLDIQYSHKADLMYLFDRLQLCAVHCVFMSPVFKIFHGLIDDADAVDFPYLVADVERSLPIRYHLEIQNRYCLYSHDDNIWLALATWQYTTCTYNMTLDDSHLQHDTTWLTLATWHYTTCTNNMAIHGSHLQHGTTPLALTTWQYTTCTNNMAIHGSHLQHGTTPLALTTWQYMTNTCNMALHHLH